MKLNKLELKDRPIFNKYLSFSRHELAAFSFPGIYIWRALFDIRWEMIEESLCVFFRDKIGCFMYLPPLSAQRRPAVIKKAFVIMDKANANRDISRIENVGQEDVDYFRALGYLCRRKYPDYLCSRSDLESLKGNKFKSQRASCNYFIKHCDCRVLKFAPGHKSACLDLFDEWARERGGRITDDLYRGMLEDSRLVIKEALSVSRRLGLEGIIVKSEGNIKGFTLGYRLNDDIFCVLYEITDLSVKGLAQFIFRRFSAELKKYTYINIMDDSGLDNLRKAKLSYKPERLIPAYIATRDA